MHLPTRREIEQISYFDAQQSRGFKAIMLAMTIRKVAATLLFLFGPIYIYTVVGENMSHVVVYFILASIAYLATLGFNTSLLNTIGFRNALRLSMVASALYALTFAFMKPENLWITMPLSILWFTLFRYLHWVPYLTDFAKFTNEIERGRQTGFASAVSSLVGIIMPLVGGWLIAQYGLPVLFGVVVVLYVVAIIPYSMIPKTDEEYSWSAGETWREFFRFSRSHVMIAHYALGAEGTIRAFLWPIFIFELLKGDYFQVGALSALVVFAVVLLNLVTGRFIDKKGQKDHALKTTSILYAVGWIFKMFIFTAFHIFVVDVYHRLVFAVRQIPFDAVSFDIAADEGHYIDEYTVLREMAVHVGRIVVGVGILVLLLFLSFKWAFVLAALASILMSTIVARDLSIGHEHPHMPQP